MGQSETSAATVEETLYDAMARLGPKREDITREATFEELDLDSLDVVELAQVVEERWAVELDPQDFSNISTVGEAVDLVRSRLP
jgi:acyl carrier protein